jgi:probable rRNA maturation factor
MLEGDKRWAVGLELIDDSTPALPQGVQSKLCDLATAIISALGLHAEVELCIRVVDLDEMSVLHEQWMGEPGATDVLSFPMDELRPCPPGGTPEEGVLGDIVICPAYVDQEGYPDLHERLELLVVHGMLHLVGMDHADEEDQRRMFDLQEELLQQWRSQAPAMSPGTPAPTHSGSVDESH